MAGNKQYYVTTEGCSITGLSVGCPVGGSDGWYSDGTYSYYVSNGVVTSVETAPCYTAPPPPPPPPTYDYYDYEPCAGGAAYTGGVFSIQVISGNNPPNSILYRTQCHSVVSGPNTSPTYTVISYSSTGCRCE